MIEYVTNQIQELLTKTTDVFSFSLNGIKLGNSFEEVPINEIVDISLSKQKDGKFIENASDFTFQERLTMLEDHDGYIFLAGGLGVHIQNQKIDQIKISKNYLEPFKSIDKIQIEKCFGKPDYELIDDTMMGVTIYDYSIDSYISVYGKLYLFFEPANFRLIEIKLGNVVEKYYTKKDCSAY